jgi:hypothetical protein
MHYAGVVPTSEDRQIAMHYASVVPTSEVRQIAMHYASVVPTSNVRKEVYLRRNGVLNILNFTKISQLMSIMVVT